MLESVEFNDSIITKTVRRMEKVLDNTLDQSCLNAHCLLASLLFLVQGHNQAQDIESEDESLKV